MESAQPKILIIDDDESVRESLTAVLEAEGYQVDVAKDGAEAISKAESGFYNLALVDFRLPDMDGTELLTSMRDTVPKMVKIMITGYPELDNAVEAVNKGADGYLIKPYVVENLLRMIKEHLLKQQKEKEYSEERVSEFVESRARELT